MQGTLGSISHSIPEDVEVGSISDLIVTDVTVEGSNLPA